MEKSMHLQDKEEQKLPIEEHKDVLHANIDIEKAWEAKTLLRKIIEANGWKEVVDHADIMWQTSFLSEDDIDLAKDSKAWLNRYPNSHIFAHKKELSLIMEQMSAYFPEEYKFYPTTYLLPEDRSKLDADLSKNTGENKKTFILKPSCGTQGKGIKLFQSKHELMEAVTLSKTKEFVVQQYIDDPLLLNKKKFDLRIYIILAGINPVNCFLCNEGLARFCTENYEKPEGEGLGNALAHLTNYSLNKESGKFVTSSSILEANEASKRTLHSMYESLSQAGIDKEAVKENIKRVLTQIVLALEPFLSYEHHTAFGKNKKYNKRCFQIYGFDILLDSKLHPWLLEINFAPSMNIKHNRVL